MKILGYHHNILSKNNGIYKSIKDLKSKLFYSGKNCNELPYAASPLVVYMATTKKTMKELADKEAKEASNRMVPNDTKWNEEQSRAILKNRGISQNAEQNTYLNNDGTIKSDKLKQYDRQHSNSVTHKGAPDDIHNQPYVNDPNAEIGGDMPKIYEPEDYELIQQDPELLADLRELNSMDAINLPPQLQNIYDAPSFDSAAELIRDILGDDYSDLANIDWDFWSILDAIGDSIVDIGDWL